jgi:hypothetical protein
MSKRLDSFLRRELRKTILLAVIVIALLAWVGYRMF